jgi:hypothetical protein
MPSTYRSGGRNKVIGRIRDTLAVSVRSTSIVSCASPRAADSASVQRDPLALANWHALVERLRIAGTLQSGHGRLYELYVQARALRAPPRTS